MANESVPTVELNTGSVNGKKKGYDFEQVSATASNLQANVLEGIGNLLNGSTRPDSSQTSTCGFQA